MRNDTLLSRVVQTDETRVPVQDPGYRKTKSGRLAAQRAILWAALVESPNLKASRLPKGVFGMDPSLRV